MALLHSYVDDEFLPDYGTLVVRDLFDDLPDLAGEPEPAAEARFELNTAAQPGGSIIRAGDGWLEAVSTDEYQHVRLEAHDCPPPDDRAAWEDVAETPFFTAGGRIGLNWLIPTDDTLHLELAPGERQRVRLSRRANPAGEGSVFRLEFWPAETDWPRCLVRADPEVDVAALASDLVAIAWWAPDQPARLSRTELAELLLVPPEAVENGLRFAEAEALLAVEGDRIDPGQVLGLTVQLRQDDPHYPVEYVPLAQPGPPWREPEAAEYGSYRPPEGPPPVAGFVRGAEGGRPERATLTRAGTLVLSAGHVELRSPEGSTVLLEDGHNAAVCDGGQALAVAERHFGRRSWSRLHLIELADGTRHTMPWDDQDDLQLTGAHGRTLYALTGSHGPHSVRWTPGSEPEPLPFAVWAVDAATGTLLAVDENGRFVLTPEGTRIPVEADGDLKLGPGGGFLYEFRGEPPGLVITELVDPAQPRTIWLPDNLETFDGHGGGPVWEDGEHLVLLASASRRPQFDGDGLRVDVRTGEFEQFVLGVPFWETTLVEPLPV